MLINNLKTATADDMVATPNAHNIIGLCHPACRACEIHALPVEVLEGNVPGIDTVMEATFPKDGLTRNLWDVLTYGSQLISQSR